MIDAGSGRVLFGRHATQRRAIASTTKLMTAYVTLHHSPLERMLTVQPYAPAPQETTAGLRAGQRLSVRELLEAMMLPSAGDAANTLAIDLGGSLSGFLAMMNRDARTLHLPDTHYSTPVGLDTPGNYSSALDLARLARRLLEDRPFAQIVGMSSVRLADGQLLVNRNDLVARYRWVHGVKTGHTAQAGFCLVGAGSRDGASVISVTLGDGSEATRDADTLALLDYGLSQFERVTAVSSARVYARVPVSGRPGELLRLYARHSVHATVRRGDRVRVSVEGTPVSVSGPLAPDTTLGRLRISTNARTIARVALINHHPLAPAPTPAGETAGILASLLW